MAGGSLTSSLVVRLIDQVSGPAKKVGAALSGLTGAGKGNMGARLSAAIEKNNRALDTARGRVLDAVGAFYLLKEAITGPVKAAMDFESAMSDVRKVVDFPTPKAFKEFQDGLVSLSKRVPLSVNGLAKIAAAAGQAGIAGDDLNRFTEAAAKVGVAFDISADKAGDAMAKLMTGLGLSIDQAVSLTDAMNHLSNAQASSAAEVLDVVRRVGAQGKQFGFTAEQVAAFGSAMVAAGSETDVAATSFRNMGLALTKGEAATKSQLIAFRELGLEAEDVAKAMQDDAVGTTLDVFERLAKMPKHRQAALSAQLFGNEARSLPTLLTNMNLLKESLGLVGDQSKYAGSSFKEYEVRAQTFANKLQLFLNKFEAFKISIGNALLPVLTELMDTLGPIVEGLTKWAEANPKLASGIAKVAAGLIAIKAASAGLAFLGLMGKGGALTAAALAWNTLGRALVGAAKGAGGMVALQRALAAMSGVKMTALQTVGAALRGMALAVPGVAGLGRALAVIGAVVGTVSAPALLAIAAAAAAIGAAGLLIYRYWGQISSYVSGFASALASELQPAIDAIRPALQVFSTIGSTIASGWNAAKSALSGFAGWLTSFFSQSTMTEGQKEQWANAGRDAATRLIAAIKGVLVGLPAAMVSLGAQAGAALGNAIVAAVQSAISGLAGMISSAVSGAVNGAISRVGTTGGPVIKPVGRFPTQAQKAAAAPAGSGPHRAGGGPVWRGGSFLVGERGPELFTPPTNGRIHPNGAGGGVTVNATINIHGQSDPRAAARAAVSELQNKLSAAQRGLYAD